MLNRAEINLKNLLFNVKEIKKRLKKEVKLCAVVKADAYGHGAEVVANSLYKDVSCFAVALVEEGVFLRLSGIDKEILVLTPIIKEDVEKAIKYNLTLTVTKLKDISLIEKIALKLAVTATIHIKYDTGMGRYGVENKEELKKILKRLTSCKAVKLTGFYSHLANPINKTQTEKAVNEFLLAKEVVKSYNNKVIFHLSASGGFLKGLYFDMVRIGILLYGYKPFEDDSIKLKPVMKLKAPIMKEKKLKAGESAMYGFCPAKEDEDVLLTRFGYADGLPRENYEELFNNRCMDVSLYKKGSAKKEGNFLTVMEDASCLAKKINTISYEVLTKIALRAEKIYKR